MFEYAKILNKFNFLYYYIINSIIIGNGANINNLLFILIAFILLKSIYIVILVASPNKVRKIIFIINIFLKVIKEIKLKEFNKDLKPKVKPIAKK